MSAAIVWSATFAFSIATFRVLNDHFDRISRGRQLAVYGDVPFRDFFEPGYLLTVFTSAAVWRVAGDTLLGEVLLSAACFATGAVLVLLLARRASGSWLTAWIAVALAVLAMPRAYDYDKFLFYPLGVLLCWRYVDRLTPRSLVVLAAGIVVAGLYRYDHGIMLLGAALPALLVRWAGDLRRLTPHAAVFALALLGTALPALVFVQFNGGLGSAVDQIVTYAWRERSRFAIDTPPITFEGLATIEPADPPNTQVRIRWTTDADEASKEEAAQLYSLRSPVPDETDDRTASYVVEDVSFENLRALVADARVEDTHGIDRGDLSVPPEPLWTRLRRAVPLLRLRLHLSEDNANAILYYLFLVVPVVAAIPVVRRGSTPDPAERARIVSVIAMLILLDVFILRPVEIRGAGMAGPLAILAAWLVGRARRAAVGPGVPPRAARVRGRALRAGFAALVALIAWSESVTAEWEERMQPVFEQPARTLEHVRTLAAAPPAPHVAPGRLAEMIVYVRSCTAPDDRIFTNWFVPELYFFAQRGFAGGMAVTFSAHWSEPRFQQQIVERLEAESVPLVIIDVGRRDLYMQWYPVVWEYVTRRFQTAAVTDFGNPYSKGYEIMVARDREPTGTDPNWSLPCFAPPEPAKPTVAATSRRALPVS